MHSNKRFIMVAMLAFLPALVMASDMTFSRRDSWLSRSELVDCRKSDKSPRAMASISSLVPSGRSKVREFDLTISMYRQRTAAERLAISQALTNFAYAVYEATDGYHKLRTIRVFEDKVKDADIVWMERGWPNAYVRQARAGTIYMFDVWDDNTHALTEIAKCGAGLAHEWGHAEYGLGDEYQYKENERQPSVAAQWPGGRTVPVAVSLMANATLAASSDGKTLAKPQYLNLSEGLSEYPLRVQNAPPTKKSNVTTWQYEYHLQSCWEQLIRPFNFVDLVTKKTTDISLARTPHYEELAKDLSPLHQASIELTGGVNRDAVSSLNILWATAIAIEVGIVIDTSGSMEGSLEGVKRQAGMLIDTLPEGTSIGVIGFSGRNNIYSVLGFTKLTAANRSLLKAEMERKVKAASGNTALWDAAAAMLNQITADGVMSRASIILLTDGGDNESENKKKNIIAQCRLRNIAFNAVAYGSSADVNLGEVASGTGGRLYGADDEVTLSKAFARAATHAAGREAVLDSTAQASPSATERFMLANTSSDLSLQLLVSPHDAQTVIELVDPSGARVVLSPSSTAQGSATYVHRIAQPKDGEWTVKVSAPRAVRVESYADCRDSGGVTFDAAIDASEGVVRATVRDRYSIEGANVVGSVQGSDEVPFTYLGAGVYTAPLSAFPERLARTDGIVVKASMRAGSALLNKHDGSVSPVLSVPDQPLTYSCTRTAFVSADEVVDALGCLRREGTATVSDVHISSRWPYGGEVDIDYTLAVTPSGAKAAVTVFGTDHTLNRVVRAVSVTGPGATSLATAGRHRITWDIGNDVPGFHTAAFSVNVSAVTVPAVPDVRASDGMLAEGTEVSWTALSRDCEYEVWRGARDAAAPSQKMATVSGGSWIDADAESGKDYRYWVRAVIHGHAGEFGGSDVGWRMVPSPKDVRATQGTEVGKVVVRWTGVAGYGEYRVYRSQSPDFASARVDFSSSSVDIPRVPDVPYTINDSVNRTSVGVDSIAVLPVIDATRSHDCEAASGVRYYFWVTTVANDHESQPAGPCVGYASVNAPGGVQAADGDRTDSTVISWTAVASADHYEVWRSESSSVGSARKIGTATTAVYQDTTATPGLMYWYWVKTVIGEIASDYSASDTGFRAAVLTGTSTYLIVDVSAGPSAKRYPVREVNSIPGGSWGDEYKLTKIALRRVDSPSFTMGSGNAAFCHKANESMHTVKFTHPFYVGVFEVTQKQWSLVSGSNPSYWTGDKRPVDHVSYNAIRGKVTSSVEWPKNLNVNPDSFMGRLRARTGVQEFDLPTESQWECASRAGTRLSLGNGNLKDAYSDELMDRVGRYMYNHNDGRGGYNRTTTVGSYEPNGWGFYDMHGNVSEWCLDYYQEKLGTGTRTDPKGPSTGSYRLLRGGDYDSYASDCRSSTRDFGWPSDGEKWYGFRLAKTVP